MTVLLVATLTAKSDGVVEETVGGVVSAAGVVVKLQTWFAASALPARSVMPPVRVTV